MLIKLTIEYAAALSEELKKLSKQDKEFFSPHEFDVKSIGLLLKEQGNHYYLYLDDSDTFVGYGILRTFRKYEIPTLGCVIWRKFRGKRHGDKLIKELISKAKELGYRKIRLKVRKENEIAYSLYKKSGFAWTGQMEDNNIWMEYVIEKDTPDARKV